MERIDRFGSFFWFFIGVLISFSSTRIGLGSFKKPGPGLIPFIIGSLLELLSIILFIQSFSIQSKGNPPRESLLEPHWKKRGVVLISLIAYVLFFAPLGYVISTTLLLGFLFNLYPSCAKIVFLRLAGACIISLLSHLVFKIWLGCPLPAGILTVRF
jgi:hypothetical protein